MIAYALHAALTLSLIGAAICVWLLIEPTWLELRAGLRRRLADILSIERRQADLTQAGLERVPLAAWLGFRGGVALVGGLLAYLIFGVLVLGLVVAIVCYHLVGLALETQRRRRREQQQLGLLDALRYGAAVMSQGGSATDMLKALAQGGPPIVRPLFTELAGVDAASQADHLDQLREQVVEPLFDDFALALLLHWKRGAKLVPALSVIVQDWEESIRMRREAKALRAGVEASVLILSLLPFAFLLLLRLLAPMLLQPLHSPSGQLLLVGAVLWMLLGYRILQRMAAPPVEERLGIKSEAL
jgi:tight adherence protein B